MNQNARDPKVPLHPVLLNRARTMRVECAPAEQKLWSQLRNRQLGGFKFRRQVPLESFIADFFCHELGLVVELDGDSHSERERQDQVRTEILTRDGYIVIRFANDDVFRFLDSVLEALLAQCEQMRDRAHPHPLPEGEGTRATNTQGSRAAFPPLPSGEGRGEGALERMGG